jgi:two-component system, chemotaxis family, response regulator Rcp1
LSEVNCGRPDGDPTYTCRLAGYPCGLRCARRYATEKWLRPNSDRSPNLLAVEDNPADAELLKFVFAKVDPGCRIRVVGDGEAAVAYLLSHATSTDDRPDLILLDLNLPRMNGHEVLRFIKADLIMRSIPVIVLTSSTAPADVTSAYFSRANSYLRKPNDLSETFEMVRALQRFWLDLVVVRSFR